MSDDGYIACSCNYTDQKTLKTCQCIADVPNHGDKCKICKNGCHPMG